VEFGTRIAKAQPFMRPAIDAGRGDAMKVIEQTFKEELEKLKFEKGGK